MEYMSCAEAAGKWGISERRVQKLWRKTKEYIITAEMSKLWGISSRRISLLCNQGRVLGAEKRKNIAIA